MFVLVSPQPLTHWPLLLPTARHALSTLPTGLGLSYVWSWDWAAGGNGEKNGAEISESREDPSSSPKK